VTQRRQGRIKHYVLGSVAVCVFRGRAHRSQLLLGLPGLVLFVAGAGVGLSGCPGGGFWEVGTHVCLSCHDGRSAPDQSGFVESPHAEMDCEACHGPGYLHVRNGGRGGLFINGLEDEPSEQVALCAQCHEAAVDGYRQGAHAVQGAAVCGDCHDVHAAQDNAAASCSTCHSQRAASFAESGHALLYGLSCGDCHSLHAVPQDDDAQLCQTCHGGETAGYRQSGHAQEAGGATCADCHAVHGPDSAWPSYTNNDVCLQCHAGLGFSTATAVEAHTRHPVDPEGTGASRCVGCHLPPLRRTEQEAGPHDHTLFTLPPITSNEAADAGVMPVPPNSCAGIAGCHDGTVARAPVFDVDNADMNVTLQAIYDANYKD